MYKRILAVVVMQLSIQYAHADTYPSDDLITDPRPENFSVCYHGTCEATAVTGLEPGQWQRIRNIFKQPRSGAAEREQIKTAVALMERMVGELIGTHVDKAGTFAHLGEQGQLDCIDESVNTSFYIRMMEKDGLIRGHTLEDRAHRGFFIFGWPHSTAVIRDTQSQQRYAVDSWFLDNGRPPYIIPLQQWNDGWNPPHFD